MTTTPPADPKIEAVAARLKADSQEHAEAYGPPIWKRPRKPKSIKAKKAELAKQRMRLKATNRPAPAGPPGGYGRISPNST
ncbi:hypothetical protein [Streptomyces sp. NBC_00233]|uniref:hypothetical protein n=1 Tax=Streptomyces sp. NBC_00233 TaxID=2975686 RepID=UPI002257ACC2|nr:hypothetical protein [Streptomyces sp. NBC_00233]MCX5232971.1 hypothetical protein [Streptomyces sp. NBC_00233]